MTDLSGRALTTNSIMVEWFPPTNRLLTRYLVRYRPTDYDETGLIDEWLGPSHNSYIIRGLRPFQPYNISLIPYLNEINGNESFVIVRTLSSLPSAPPQNVTVSSVMATVMSSVCILNFVFNCFCDIVELGSGVKFGMRLGLPYFRKFIFF